MDEATAREWRQLSQAEREKRILTALLTGNVIQLSIPERLLRGPDATLPGNIYDRAKELERRGIIVGYAPVLSEEGRRYLDGLGVAVAPFATEDSPEARVALTDCPFCTKPLSGHQSVKCTLKPTEAVTIETKVG